MPDRNTYDAIMDEITQGLTGDPQHDGKYLMEQSEKYKDHEFGQEIVRACGRLIWETLPEDTKAELSSTIENHNTGREAVFREVLFNVQNGNPENACRLLEPLIQEFDECIEAGIDMSDSVSEKCDFANIREYTMYLIAFQPEKDVRPTMEDYTQAYALYGQVLFELHRHEEAIDALTKALIWDPVSTSVLFEIGENYKVLEDMDSFIAYTDKAYPYIFTAVGMARYHRNKGFYGIETGKYEKAAAHFLVSTIFEQTPLAMSELMYMKQQFGADYTDMDIEIAASILEKNEEKITISGEGIAANQSVLNLALEQEDEQLAVEVLYDIWKTTMDDEAKELLDKLVGE